MQKNRKTIAIVGSTLVVAALCGYLMINYEDNILPNQSFLAEPNSDDLYLFSQYMSEYKKNYKRIQDFKDAINNFKVQNDAIKKFNSNSKDLKLGLNQFSDLSNSKFAEISRIQQFKKSDQNYQTSNVTERKDISKVAEELSNQFDKSKNNQRKLQTQTYPANFDHRSKGVVTSIKNQGLCASSYAFAAMAQAESFYLISNSTKHKGVDLSEQYVVDCSYDFMGKIKGCIGGTVYHTYVFISKYFYPQESVYPYVAQLQACNYTAQNLYKYGFVVNATMMINLTSAQLMSIVYQIPVVALVASQTQVFRYYKSGIISQNICTGNLDLAVLIIGWGTQGSIKFWIIKNQWGTTWGEKGFAKIQMSDLRGGTCGINQELYYSIAV